MKKYGRMAAGVCLTVLALSVAACAGRPEGTQKAETSVVEDIKKTEAAELKIGICIYDFNDNFMTLYRKELKEYLVGTHGISEENIFEADGENDPEKQSGQIDQLTEQGVDALILNLVQVSKAQTVTDKCKEAGIPVVFINREPEETEINRWAKEGIAAAYIGADSGQSGAYQGEIILETPNKGDFNGDGTVSYVMIMGDSNSQDAVYRSEYAVKALEDGGMKSRKLFEGHGGWSREKGQALAADALARYGDKIEVIFCNNDAMANGAMAAVEEAGRTVGRDIYLVGVDALEETVGYIKEGRVTGTVLNDYAEQARMAADAAVKMIAGEKTEVTYMADYVKIAIDRPLAEPEKEEWEEGLAFDVSSGAKGFKAGVFIENEEDNFMALYCAELGSYFRDVYQAETVVRYGDGSLKNRLVQIDDLISEGADVVILNLGVTADLKKITNRCGEAGIPVVLINCEPDEEEIQRWNEEAVKAAFVGAAELSGYVVPDEAEGADEADREMAVLLASPNGPFHAAADIAAQMAAGNEVEGRYVVRYLN